MTKPILYVDWDKMSREDYVRVRDAFTQCIYMLAMSPEELKDKKKHRSVCQALLALEHKGRITHSTYWHTIYFVQRRLQKDSSLEAFLVRHGVFENIDAATHPDNFYDVQNHRLKWIGVMLGELFQKNGQETMAHITGDLDDYH